MSDLFKKKAAPIQIQTEWGPVTPNLSGCFFPTQRRFGVRCGSVITVSFDVDGNVNYAFSDYSRCTKICGECHQRILEIKDVFAAEIGPRSAFDDYRGIVKEFLKDAVHDDRGSSEVSGQDTTGKSSEEK